MDTAFHQLCIDLISSCRRNLLYSTVQCYSCRLINNLEYFFIIACGIIGIVLGFVVANFGISDEAKTYIGYSIAGIGITTTGIKTIDGYYGFAKLALTYKKSSIFYSDKIRLLLLLQADTAKTITEKITELNTIVQDVDNQTLALFQAGIQNMSQLQASPV